METKKEAFTKQYFHRNNQDQTKQYPENVAMFKMCSSFPNYDEPIDLTFGHRSSEQDQQKNQPPKLTEVLQNPDYFVKKRRKRKFAYTPDGKMYLVPNETNQSPFGNLTEQNAESKQVEVLKAAKSLFSKRTRTLYHWMYPNAPKQQIKLAVANSWESLGAQEKEFYISQVLGRFGFSQSSLMVNPQLGGIKDLPPLPDMPEFNTKAHELQNAISSITPDNNPTNSTPANDRSNYSFGFFGVDMSFDGSSSGNKSKKRRGRPTGSRTARRKFVRADVLHNCIGNDFQDDPELSQELEQFALNMFKTKN